MASKVEICKLALAAIRAQSINSLTEPSVEAQQCSLHYDVARTFVLRDAQWQFARKISALQLRSEEPLHWLYAYQYPGDCLKLRTVTGSYLFKAQRDVEAVSRSRFVDDWVEPERDRPFEIQNDGDNLIIATDEKEAYGIYTTDVTDTNLFDASFTTAFAYYLGSLIAVPLTGADIGNVMREKALQLYSSTMSSAVAHDMNEQKQLNRRVPAQVKARR